MANFIKAKIIVEKNQPPLAVGEETNFGKVVEIGGWVKMPDGAICYDCVIDSEIKIKISPIMQNLILHQSFWWARKAPFLIPSMN